jgi:peroxiredoxin
MLFILCGLATASAVAAKFNRVVDIGDAAHRWSALPGIDGKPLALDDLKDSKAVVVMFIANHCPVVAQYDARIKELSAEFQSQGVTFVGITCSLETQDGLEPMRERAKKSGWEFPWLFDASQESGKKYGATATPQVFVLDGERKIAYMGAIDSDRTGKSIETHYLRDAVKAVLNGKAADVTETRAIGCQIVYEGE